MGMSGQTPFKDLCIPVVVFNFGSGSLVVVVVVVSFMFQQIVTLLKVLHVGSGLCNSGEWL